jgi:hypothetical protein
MAADRQANDRPGPQHFGIADVGNDCRDQTPRSIPSPGVLPGVERQPPKSSSPMRTNFQSCSGWRAEAEKAGHELSRIAVIFETGRDGFWLARWSRVHRIEVDVIDAASIVVSREHQHAKN